MGSALLSRSVLPVAVGKPIPRVEASMRKPIPQVGVAVFLTKGRKLLLGRRLTSIAHDTFAPPGGHLEFGESFEECAAREVKEETGLDIDKIQFLTVNNLVSEQTKPPIHRVVIFMGAVVAEDGQKLAQNLEPDKCGGWDWYEWDKLPAPLFPPFDTMVGAGFNPFQVAD